MKPEALRKKQIEFFAIGILCLIGVGIFAALDAGNDIGEVLIGLVQFLAILGVAGVGVYLNRHRLQTLLKTHPTPPPQTAPRPQAETESRLVLLAPSRHQMLTFDETAKALESAVHELATLQAHLTKKDQELGLAETQLHLADQNTQRAVDAAVGVAQVEWGTQRAAIEERHAATLQRLEQERDAALAAAGRTTLPELLQFVKALAEGRMTRGTTKKVATFSNKDYGPFAQSVRILRFAAPSPTFSSSAFEEIRGESIASDLIPAGEGGADLGRTEIEASDGPSDRVLQFPIVLYNAEFARLVG